MYSNNKNGGSPQAVQSTCRNYSVWFSLHVLLFTAGVPKVWGVGGGTVPLQGWTDGLNTVFPLYIAIVLSLSTSLIFFIIIIIPILRAFRYTGYLGKSFFSISNILANAVNVYEETDKKHGGVK